MFISVLLKAQIIPEPAQLSLGPCRPSQMRRFPTGASRLLQVQGLDGIGQLHSTQATEGAGHTVFASSCITRPTRINSWSSQYLSFPRRVTCHNGSLHPFHQAPLLVLPTPPVLVPGSYCLSARTAVILIARRLVYKLLSSLVITTLACIIVLRRHHPPRLHFEPVGGLPLHSSVSPL